MNRKGFLIVAALSFIVLTCYIGSHIRSIRLSVVHTERAGQFYRTRTYELFSGGGQVVLGTRNRTQLPDDTHSRELKWMDEGRHWDLSMSGQAPVYGESRFHNLRTATLNRDIGNGVWLPYWPALLALACLFVWGLRVRLRQHTGFPVQSKPDSPGKQPSDSY